LETFLYSRKCQTLGVSPAKPGVYLLLINDHLGYLAEVYMAQVLWNGQRKTLAGRFFHSNEDVTLPWRFIYIRHRTRLGAAKEILRKAEALREAEGEGLETMRVWFFAHDGFTEKAEGLMKKKDVLWSVRDDLDGLLESVGLRRLPNIVNKNEIKESVS